MNGNRIRGMLKSLSISVMAAGLLGTVCLDYVLIKNHRQIRQMDIEIFTPYAVHHLEGIDGMVKWWDVVTSLMESKLEDDPEEYMAQPSEPAMVLAMNPMIRSIQICRKKEGLGSLQLRKAGESICLPCFRGV